MTSPSMTCPHGRLFRDTCEDCRYVAALERGEPTAALAAAATGKKTTAPVNATPAAAPDVVDVDTHIARADLGDGAYTLVRAGDPVPPALADLPRRPAGTDASTPASSRKR